MARNTIVTSNVRVLHADANLVCRLCHKVIQVGEYLSYEGRRHVKRESWHSFSSCQKVIPTGATTHWPVTTTVSQSGRGRNNAS